MPTSLNTASARLDRALAASRAAETELVLAALQTLCLSARADHPGIYGIEFEWSDQGDFLMVSHLLAGDRTPVEWEDEGDVAFNLEGHTESVWAPFMARITDPILTYNVRCFRLPITAALEALAENGDTDD
jgi:hypothetical protein